MKRNMRKKAIRLKILLIFVAVVILGGIGIFVKNYVSNYAKSNEVEKVHFLKNWTIYYNVNLDGEKIKDKNINVLDAKGNKVDCEITLAPFGKSIEVLPPQDGYIQGETYTLKVGSKEDCTIEKIFDKRKSVKFQIIKEAPSSTKVVFPDKNFESLIREEIKKPTGEIGVNDVKNVTSLVLTSKSILNLKGIEYFTNLHSLSLDVNRISNIEALKNLTDLNYLGLSNNNITDISSLKDLKYLKRLFLLGNPTNNFKVVDKIYKNLDTKDFDLN